MDYRVRELTLCEKTAFRTAALAAGILVGHLFYDSFAAGLIIGILMFFLEKPFREALKESRQRVLAGQFKDMLYSMASSVSTGRDLGQAIEESAVFWQGTYDEDDLIIREIRLMEKKMKQSNMSSIEVLGDFASRSGLEDAEDLTLICATCRETGADLAAALQKGADIIGDKISMEREIQTVMSQKRFEGRIVGAMPVLITAAIRIVSPEYLAPLFQTMTGRIISTFSLILMTAGFLSIERVNKIEI